MRADVYLTDKGFCESRTKSSRLISEGKVYVDGKRVLRASENIDDGEHTIEITEREKYVSRGGLKLEAALDHFKIDVKGKRCIDVGASTGGFTDCLLQREVRSVCAVDSGRGQLHPKVSSDNRVTSLEGCNARYLSRDEIGDFDMAVMDVSFISQTLIHKALADLLCDGAIFVSLIKPQFELERSKIGKGGIVKGAKLREDAVRRVISSARSCGFMPIGLIRSPIEGGDGNVEYLAVFKRTDDNITAGIDEFNMNIKKICE